MEGSLKSFIISFTAHIFIFIVIYIFSWVNNYNNRFIFTMVNQGGSFAVNIKSENFEKENNKKQVKADNKKKYDYPEDNNAILQLKQKKLLTKEPIKKSPSNYSSGGSGNNTTEVVPVLENKDIVNYTPPTYPKYSLSVGEQGCVVVRMLVNPTGKILKINLYKSSGFRHLDNAVMKVTKFWTVNNPPLYLAWVEIRVNFVLK